MCQVWDRPTRVRWGLLKGLRSSGLTHITRAGPAKWAGAKARFGPYPLLLMGLGSALAAPQSYTERNLCTYSPGFTVVLHTASYYLHTFV